MGEVKELKDSDLRLNISLVNRISHKGSVHQLVHLVLFDLSEVEKMNRNSTPCVYVGVPMSQRWVEEFGYEHINEMVADFQDLVDEYIGGFSDLDIVQYRRFFMQMHVHELQNFWKANTGEELVLQSGEN